MVWAECKELPDFPVMSKSITLLKWCRKLEFCYKHHNKKCKCIKTWCWCCASSLQFIINKIPEFFYTFCEFFQPANLLKERIHRKSFLVNLWTPILKKIWEQLLVTHDCCCVLYWKITFNKYMHKEKKYKTIMPAALFKFVQQNEK